MEEFKTPSQIPKLTTPKVNKPVEVNENINSQTNGVCQYVEPEWSGIPSGNDEYKFEVLKLGIIVEEIRNLEKKPYWIFGRLPSNDIVMAHPTISRYHAVLQFRIMLNDEPENAEEYSKTGWYIYDLGSTHGTFVNKMRIPPKMYVRIHVGHIIKLGTSTRHFILQGPELDKEPESNFSVTELRELKFKKKQSGETEIRKIEDDDTGISWGMAEDADEETDLTINPFANTNNEDFYIEDPKKTLRGFFEREGLELKYDINEMSTGTFVCRVQLPIYDGNGKAIVTEVCHKGKKKDCILQCALESCRLLDRHNVLRQSYHEPLNRKFNQYDSEDEDDFFDRTGDIERKKQRKYSEIKKKALTYNELLQQKSQMLLEIETVEKKISEYYENVEKSKQISNKEYEDLDSYMTTIANTYCIDKTIIRKLRTEQKRLELEFQKLQRIIEITKPISFDPNNALSIKYQNLPNTTNVEKDNTILTSSNSIGENIIEEGINNTCCKSKEPQRKIACVEENIFKNDVKSNTESKNYDEINDSSILKDEIESIRKRKNRIRNRKKCRENIDDEKLESENTEKYSGWLPPENQTGDGMTELNKKLGY